jgi:hypothetical protein
MNRAVEAKPPAATVEPSQSRPSEAAAAEPSPGTKSEAAPLRNARDVLRAIYSPESFTPFHEYVLETRRLAVLRQFYENKEDTSGWRAHADDVVWMRDHLVNPVMLCTALAVALESDTDMGWFFDPWFSGAPIPHVEERLLDVEGVVPASDCKAVAKTTIVLCDQLCATASKYTHPFPKAQQTSARGHLQSWVEAKKIGDQGEGRGALTKYLIRHLVWFMANPSLYPLINLRDLKEGEMWTPWLIDHRGPQAKDMSRLIYGMYNNSRHHNYREKLEWRLNEAKGKSNSAMSSEGGRSAAQALAEVQSLQFLVNRARSLYDWNPAEIDAHFVTALAFCEIDLKGNRIPEDDKVTD